MNNWISVKDKLPKPCSEVMTWGSGTASNQFGCCQAYYSFKGWQELDCCGDFFDFPPTHWMLLPEAPKGAQ